MAQTPSAAPSATGSAAPTSSSLAVQRLLAAALGAFIVGMVGFSHMSIAHNASHDARHSMAFPCH